jgi:predicted DNA-binding protein
MKMDKEIRWSEHAQLKLDILNQRSIKTSAELIAEIIQNPNIRIEEEDRKIAQSPITDDLVLRVVYREYSAFILIITLYPGRRSRYEKDSLQ